MKDMIGKIRIRIGGDYQRPAVVYVSSISSQWNDVFVCYELNTDIIIFASKDKLIDFENLKQFRKLVLDWEYKQCDIKKEKIKKELEEIK